MQLRFIIIILSVVLYPWSSFSQKLEKLPASINTEYDEIMPVLSEDGKRLYFTRVGYPEFNKTIIHNGEVINYQKEDEELDRLLKMFYSAMANEKIENPQVSDFNQDIWIAHLSPKGKIIDVKHPDFPLNDAFPNSVLSIVAKTGELILLNKYDYSGNISEGISLFKDSGNPGLNEIKPIYVSGYGSSDGLINLTTNHDGSVIIWSLRRADSYGDRDLYISKRLGDRIYSTPRNMGPKINTPYRESTPHLSADGKTLFFSSNRPGGFGGTDIYSVECLDEHWNKWSAPKLFDRPINSGYDDSQPIPSPDGKYIYFTSTRDGSSDIYRYQLIEDEEEPAEIEDVVSKEDIVPDFHFQPDPAPIIMSVWIDGLVSDSITGNPIPSEISWGEITEEEEDGKTSRLSGYFRTLTGEFTDEIVTGKRYVFEASSRGYQKKRVELDLTEVYDSTIQKTKVNISLVRNKPSAVVDKGKRNKKVKDPKPDKENVVANPILTGTLADSFKVEKTIILGKIYFVQSKPTVLGKSMPALNDLYRTMRKNKEDIILISGHTDNRGPEELLMELSEARAMAIKNFLTNRGISSDRIKIIGYGATRPLNDNSSEELRRQNRRVEISFLKKN